MEMEGGEGKIYMASGLEEEAVYPVFLKDGTWRQLPRNTNQPPLYLYAISSCIRKADTAPCARHRAHLDFLPMPR